MEYAKVCLVLCAFVLLCAVGGGAEEVEVEVAPPEAPVPVATLAADLVDAGENSQADVDVDGNVRKARQYFGPPPPPFFGPPPPPYYGGFGGGYGGGYGGYGGGFGFGGGYQRTRVVTRTRYRGGYRGGYGGFGGAYYG